MHRASSPRGRLRAVLAFTLSLSAAIAQAPPAAAKVFYAREEVPALAFPDADKVEPHDYFLTAEQKAEIERRARSPLDSELLTIYTGRKEGRVLGYAILDTHVVRTLPETFLIVITPDGSIIATHVLAFYEPLEYLPGKRWLSQFKGRRLVDGLRVGEDIAAITGSTLSSRAVVEGVRRALAACQVLIEQCDSLSAESGRATSSSR